MEKAVCIKSMRRRHIQIEICTTTRTRSSRGLIESSRGKTLTACTTKPIGRGFQVVFPFSDINEYGEKYDEKSGPCDVSSLIHRSTVAAEEVERFYAC